MKNALIGMAFMMAFLVLCAGPITWVFRALLGGGLEWEGIYLICGGIVALTGIIVGAATMILDEIERLRKSIEDKEK